MQSKIICPKCRSEIPLDNVNVSTDIALCRQCSQTWSYAELVQDNLSDIDLMNPPKGAWYRETPPRGFQVGASTRSAGAFFLVPFICVWSGFSLGGIYGTQFTSRHFNLAISLFGIPFIMGTLIFGSAAIMMVCGKVTVTVDGDDGVIFTGVGPIGWRRRFNWRKVTAIKRTESYGRRSVSQQITFEGKKLMNIASDMKDERLVFMFGALRKKWRETSHSLV